MLDIAMKKFKCVCYSDICIITIYLYKISKVDFYCMEHIT